MTDLLNGGNFDFLKEDAAERSRLGVTSDLSFTLRKGSITQKIRDDLRVISELIEETAKALFNTCTANQLDQICNEFKPLLMLPDGTYFKLDNLAYGPAARWYACDGEGKANDLYDLDVHQLLQLMEATEHVLYSSKQNKLK